MSSPAFSQSPGGGEIPKKRRRSWFEPNNSLRFEIAVENKTKHNPVDPHEEIEVLELTHFSKSPRIDFGKIRVGKTKIRHLKVRNPHDCCQEVIVEKFPFNKNFHIDLVEFSVDAGDEQILTLTWDPLEQQNCRELVIFKVDGVYRLQTILFGVAEQPPKPKKSRGIRRAALAQKKAPATRITGNKPQNHRSPLSPKNNDNTSNRKPKKPLVDATVEVYVTKSESVERRKQDIIHEEIKENITVEYLQCSTSAPDATRVLQPSKNVPEWAIPKVPVRHAFGPSNSGMNNLTTFGYKEDTNVSVLSSTHIVGNIEPASTYFKEDGSVMQTPIPKCSSTFIESPAYKTFNVAEKCPSLDRKSAPAHEFFKFDDPAIPGTPPRRTTFIKEDPTLPQSPLRRTTYDKKEPSVLSMLQPKHSAHTRHVFTPPKSIDEADEMASRSTFEKDDPDLPSTPIRRSTFHKNENTCSNTPIIEVHSSDTNVARSASPVRKHPAHAVHFSDDTTVHNLSISHSETPDRSNLRRSGTYTKLNSSLSPKPCEHQDSLNAQSPVYEKSSLTNNSNDVVGDIFRGMQLKGALLSHPGLTHQEVLNDSLQKLAKQLESSDPNANDGDSVTTATYMTPASTPYRSPVNSDLEDEIFEDSVGYVPDQTSEWKSDCDTIFEERIEKVEIFETVTTSEIVNVYSTADITVTSPECIQDDRAKVVTETVNLIAEQVLASRPNSVEVHSIEPTVVTDSFQHTVSTTVSHSQSGTDVVYQQQEFAKFLRGFSKPKQDGSEFSLSPQITINESPQVETIDDIIQRSDLLPEYMESVPFIPAIRKLRKEERFSVDSLEADTEDRSSPEPSDTSVPEEEMENEAKKTLSFTPVQYQVQKVLGNTDETIQTPLNLDPGSHEPAQAEVVGRSQLTKPAELDESPTSLLSESFSHQEVVDQLTSVKHELKNWFSSTPLTAPPPTDKGMFQKSHMASPIVNVSAFPQSLDSVIKSSAPQARGSLVQEMPDSPEPKRVSSLTVTKSKPDILHRRPPATQKSKKELFSGNAEEAHIASDNVANATPDMLATIEKKNKVITDEVFSEDILYHSPRKRDHSLINQPVPHTGISFNARPSRSPYKTAQVNDPDDDKSGRRYQKPWRQAQPRVSLSACRAVLNTTDPLACKKRPHSMDRAVPRRKYASGSDVKKLRSGIEGQKGGDLKSRPLQSSQNDRSLNRTQQLRRQAALAGMSKSCGPPKPTPSSKGKSKSLAQGLAQSKLVLSKKPTALPKHPMPFAGKNMYYDERWMEKEERGFVRWLNFILTPPDEYFEAVKPKRIDAGRLFVDGPPHDVTLAPTKEYLSFKMYTAKRRLNRLRHKACSLFQNEENVKIIQKIEKEIERNGLAVRKDRKIHADLGIKQTILDMLLSYNPLWLRIGVEVVFGEIVPVAANTDVYGLSHFIVHRLLGNPDIAEQYAHPTVPHFYRDGYDEALAQFILKKFLLLVIFLDKAKKSRLIDHDPCLFCIDSDYKASKDLLLTFSRDYLSGEGDLTKHLGYLGYHVSHVQTALEEYNYAVTNLATDLRDGMKLTRVIEMLTNCYMLSKEMRVPAISRLQKIHNVGIAFKAMSVRGIDVENIKGGKLSSRDIVDGHREKTLHLLWKIIFNFQIDLLLNEEQLKEEIQFLTNNFKVKARLEAILNEMDGDLGLPRGKRESLAPDMYFTSPRLSLLLKWCRAVCAYYSMKVENFTVSFSDGRALCFLVHHYHPSLLPLEAIHTHTTLTIEGSHEINSDESADDSFDGLWTQAYSPTTGRPTDYGKLLENEKKNFKLLYEKVSEIGGIPVMLKSADMSNTIPDEKVVITYVSYLCARLLDIRQETRAARVIQSAWRHYQLRKRIRDKQVRQEAAIVIQRAFRTYLTEVKGRRQDAAALIIQTNWRCHRAKKTVMYLRDSKRRQREHEAATCIQAHVRGFLHRQNWMYQCAYATVIQSVWRGFLARRDLGILHMAAYSIQSHYRAYKETKEVQAQYQQLREATIKIQSVFRCLLARKVLRQQKAARTIQSVYRMWIEKRRYQKIKMAVIKVQAFVKMVLTSQKYQQSWLATVVLQRRYRALVSGRQAKSEYAQLKHAVQLAQRLHRGNRARKHVKQIRAARTIQAAYRGYKARQCLKKRTMAANKIQSWVRMIRCRSKYVKLGAAALVVQRRFRATLSGQYQRRQYLKLKQAAIVTQSMFRARAARMLVHQVRAARVIQSHYRGYQARCQYAYIYQAVVKVQATARMIIQRRRYQQLCSATSTIQQYVRAMITGKQQRQQYVKLKRAAVLAQSLFRGKEARKLAVRQRAARTIQSAFRRHQAVKSYHKTRNTVITVQRQYRAVCCGRRQQYLYHIKRGAAITIQAVVRGWLLRRKLLDCNQSAVKIQATFRGYILRQKYQKTLFAVREIQIHFRAYLKMKAAKESYLVIRQNIIKAQALYRGHIQKMQFLKLKSAAVILQNNWRRHQALQQYESKRKAALIIQNYYRAHLLKKGAMASYSSTKLSVIKVQAVVRSHLQRSRFMRIKAAVVVLQTFWRKYSCQQKYKCQRRAAMTIQHRFRDYRLMKLAVDTFHSDRESVIKVQAVVRSYIQRRNYTRVRNAATVIQSNWRKTITRQYFITLKMSACLIQKHFRGHLLRKQAMSQYQSERAYVIKCQALGKGYLQRKHYKEARSAIIKLQTWWRKTSMQRKYSQSKNASKVIQKYFRAHLLRNKIKEDYIKTRSAVIIIQSAFRGMQARVLARRERAAIKLQAQWRMISRRTSYLDKKEACVRIQSLVRGKQSRARYVTLREATITVQMRWRALNAGRQLRMQYYVTRGAAINIQAVIRGHIARKKYNKMKNGFARLQATFRAKKRSSEFAVICKSTQIIQRWYRASVKAKRQRIGYQQVRKSVICIQAAYRGMKARENYRRWLAAVKIQTAFRTYRARKEYQIMRNGFTKLQAIAKCQLQRIKYKAMKQSAISIENWYRRCQLTQNQKEEFLKTRKAIIIIQSAIRGMIARTHARKIRSALRIQAAYQGYKQRHRYLRTKAAALIIQTYTRRLIKRREFLRIKSATVILQHYYRAHLLRRKAVLSYQMTRQRIITIQSQVRMWKARKDYLTTRTGVIKLQAHIKGRYQRVKYRAMKVAALVIQNWYRGCKITKIQQTEYQNIKHSVLTIQRCYRGWRARREVKKIKAAIKIQSVFRMYRLRKTFLHKKEKVVYLQSLVRAKQEKKIYLKIQKATIAIQNRWRATMLMRLVRKQYLIKVGAIITLQSGVRGRIARRHAHKVRSAIRIQAAYLGYKQRQQYLRTKAAALIIQTHTRRLIKRREFLRIKSATVILQHYYRAHLLRRKAVLSYQMTRQRIITIQSQVRMWKARKDYLTTRTGVIKLQAHIKGRYQRVKYRAMRVAALVIQNWYRGCKKTKIQQTEYQNIKHSALTIQRSYRGWRARREVQKIKAAIKIQSVFKMHQLRKQFLHNKKKIVYLQSLVRGKQEKKRYHNRQKATITIQNRWRATMLMRRVRKQYLIKVGAIITLQASVRSYLAQKRFTQMISACVLIQSSVRGWLARKQYSTKLDAALTIQRHYRAWSKGRRQLACYRELRTATITIQSAYRGMKQRKRYQLMRSGFIKFQATFRCNQQRRHYVSLKKAVQVFVTHFSAILIGKQQRRDFLQQKQAAVCIQSLYRGYRARQLVKQTRTAILIQSVIRMHQQRKKYCAQKSAVFTLQSFYRAMKIREHYKNMKSAAVLLQSRTRAFLKGQAERKTYLQRKLSVIKCQATCRGFLARRLVRRVKAAVLIQSCVRGYLQRRQYSEACRRVLLVQTVVRRWLCRRKYAVLKKKTCAVLTIQKHYREHLVWKRQQEAKEMREDELQRFAMVCKNHLSVICIQRAVRRHQAVLLAKQQLPYLIVIQRWMRSKLQRVRYLRILRCVRYIQMMARKYLANRDGAVVRLQAAVRGWQVRKQQRTRHQAAAILQALWKGRKVRREVKCKKIRQARIKVQEATANATEEKKLCNRTTCALDYLLRYKQLAFILEAVMHLDVVTRLSPRCCERLVEGGALDVLYTLVRSCNRSIPHMEIIKYTVNILLNLAKYDRTVHAVVRDENSVETLVELMQIYREKGAIFSKTCTLLGIVCYETDKRQMVLRMPKMIEKLNSISNLTMKKHKMDEKRKLAKSRMAAANSFCGVVPFTPSNRLKIRPEWVLRRNSVRDIGDPVQAVKFVMGSLK